MHAMQQDNAWLATNGLSAMATVPILKDHSARGVHVQALDSYATGVTTKDGTAPGAPGVMPSGTPPPGGYNVFDPHYSADGPLEGGVTTGVFTGHSMGSKGGPLTFGKKTYHNVFDPDGGEDMGPCDPGQTGKAGTSTQKRECRECAATKWCAGGWDGLENDCPDQSTSYVGSYSASQCTCQIGWYGEAHYDEDKSCKMCKGMTFCPGGRNRYDCPIHSSSSDEKGYCSCDPGYWGATHDDCSLCDANSYCLGGDPDGTSMQSCTDHSNSPKGSDDGSDCQCDAGFYEPLEADDRSVGPDCVLCPPDTYCPGGKTNEDCHANSKSVTGSSVVVQCICDAGYYGDSQAGCTKCPAGSFCTGGTEKTKCPANSNSPELSVKLGDCTCNARYMGTDPEDCIVCPLGSYCPGDGVSVACDGNEVSPAGSDDGQDCQCAAGNYEPAEAQDPTKGPDCELCPVDTFCPGGKGNVACTANAASAQGSTALNDCACQAGFFGSSKGCSACPVGSYCPGGAVKTVCPANSASAANSVSIGDCACNIGFKGLDPTTCETCSAGSFCAGDGSEEACGPNAASQPGAAECYCAMNYQKNDEGECWPSYTRYVKSGSKSSSLADYGNGTFVYMDRTQVSCKSANSVINGFQLAMVADGKKKQFKFKYKCSTGGKFFDSEKKYTSWSDSGSGNLEFLDRQTVDCGAGSNSVLSQFRMKSNKDDVRFKYYCAESVAPLTQCKMRYTNLDDRGGAFKGRNLDHLDRHSAYCSDYEVMQSWHMSNHGKNIRIDYRCCRATGAADIKAIQQYQNQKTWSTCAAIGGLAGNWGGKSGTALCCDTVCRQCGKGTRADCLAANLGVTGRGTKCCAPEKDLADCNKGTDPMCTCKNQQKCRKE